MHIDRALFLLFYSISRTMQPCFLFPCLIRCGFFYPGHINKIRMLYLCLKHRSGSVSICSVFLLAIYANNHTILIII
ncbi:hypothetical protein BDF19DRAFT_446549 [Syncephalis fuscata]|nr:hypothetical protein BDF19DRAFT_446549 [Syncephalis fuscata]